MNVRYISQPNDAFSDLYLRVREKENRLFSNETVAMLPNLPKKHSLYPEWQLRKKSAMRFVAYLKKKHKPLKILDIGCGNGWFSHLLSTLENSEVTGLDVNDKELWQASEVFQKPNLTFIYANLFENTALQSERFDVIVFNSCFQYFEDAQDILAIVTKMLTEHGEIHIIDTPFYEPDQVEIAKQRTKTYYTDLGFPEMAKHYFHHSLNTLGKYKMIFKPSIFSKLLNDSLFCWIQIEKE